MMQARNTLKIQKQNLLRDLHGLLGTNLNQPGCCAFLIIYDDLFNISQILFFQVPLTGLIMKELSLPLSVTLIKFSYKNSLPSSSALRIHPQQGQLSHTLIKGISLNCTP